MNWYYARGDESIGPLNDAAFQQAVASGAVTGETLVWREGMADWIPFAAAGLSAAGISRPGSHEGICVECGKPFPLEDLIAYKDLHVCAACKPVFFQRLQEGGLVPGQLRIAPLGRRIVAKLLDLFIVTFVVYGVFFVQAVLSGRTLSEYADPESIASLVAQMSLSILGTVFQVFYNTWFVGRHGATPGKMALGLRVVRTDGEKVTYLRAFARFWAEMLSGILCYLGYIMAFFDATSRRTLHDGICDTRVITIK